MYSMEFTTLAIKLNIIASILRSNLFDFSDAYIHVKGFITVPKIAGVDATVNDTNKNVMFKNCAPFTTHITEINNTHVDDPQVIDIILTLHNIIENNDAYVKTSGPIWQYSKPVLADNNNIIDFLANNNDTVSVKQLQVKIFDAAPSLEQVWKTKILSNKRKFNGVYSRNNLSKFI